MIGSTRMNAKSIYAGTVSDPLKGYEMFKSSLKKPLWNGSTLNISRN